MKTVYDVVVVGGGTAGVVAAVQAGRAGAKTLLLEKTGILGGTIVSGGVSQPASFRAHGEQVIAGIGWELCCKTLEECGAPVPDASGSPASGGPQAFHLNPWVYAAICDEAVVGAGGDILFHAMPAAAAEKGDNSWTLTVCTKTGLRDLTARVLVDCTGDANVVELAGFDLCRSDDLQPATLVARVGGYDADALDYDAIQQAFEAEVAAGRMQHTDPGWGRGKIRFFLNRYGGNRLHVPNVDARTSKGKTKAELEGRRILMRLLRFCRTQPGLENMRIVSCAVECGIRETVTIKGKTTVTIDDYEAGRVYPDAICYSYYPIDIHRPDYIEGRPLPAGVVPTIPLGAMLPQGSRGLIAAGRCAAGDQLSNSSFRVEVPCMAMGQAAGAAAALAAQRGVNIEGVPLADVRRLLREHGAIVPGE